MGPDLLKQDKNQAMEVVNLIKVKIYYIPHSASASPARFFVLVCQDLKHFQFDICSEYNSLVHGSSSQVCCS